MDFNTLLASFASAFTQARRLLTLQLDHGDLAAEQLLPLSLDGEEGLSRPYRFTLTCLSANGRIELTSLLGVAARIGIVGADGGATWRCGLVSQARQVSSDGGFARYALTIESPFSLLRHRSTARVFQDLTVPDIVRQIFAEHQAANAAFARVQALDFQLQSGAAPRRSYVIQYRESDFAFICRLLAQEGYSWRFLHQDDGGPKVTLAIFDDADSLPASPLQRVRFHRSDATEETDGLRGWQATRQIIPGRTELASYDYQPVYTRQSDADSRLELAMQSTLTHYDAPGPYYASDDTQLGHYSTLRQQAHDRRAKQFSGHGSVRGLLPGEYFRLDGHPAHDGAAAAKREFVVTGQTLQAWSNLPHDLAAHLGIEAPPAPFTSTIQAQRRGMSLVPDYAQTEYAAPTALGAQTGTVVGPKDCREVYTDAFGRIKVQLHWQRPAEHPDIGANWDERSSCWLRVAMPSAGAGFGHQHLPRVGQEVLVDFIEGNIDRPVVTGVLYNGTHQTPRFSGQGSLPGNQTLSGIQSKEHDGPGYNELLFDDTPQQVRARLASTHGATQLNQGFLVHPRQDGQAEPRGEGFELRTDRHGAVRAAHGLLLSTEAQAGAAGHQLARQHAQAQLDAALNLSQSLGDTASAQLADSIDSKPQQQLDDHVKAWDKNPQPVMVLSAPAGIASVTEQSQTLGAGANLDLVAQRDLNHSAGRRWLANVKDHMSLFVAGVKDAISLKLIAAKGKVQAQAQHGEMAWTASQDVAVSSTKERIVIAAQEEILLNVGGGSYIRLKGGNIDLHCPGKVSLKGTHGMDGPARMTVTHPDFPHSVPKQRIGLQLNHSFVVGDHGVPGMPYKLYADGAQIQQGVLDDSGHLSVDHSMLTQQYTLELANGLKRHFNMVSSYANQPDDELANSGINHGGKALRLDQYQGFFGPNDKSDGEPA